MRIVGYRPPSRIARKDGVNDSRNDDRTERTQVPDLLPGGKEEPSPSRMEAGRLRPLPFCLVVKRTNGNEERYMISEFNHQQETLYFRQHGAWELIPLTSVLRWHIESSETGRRVYH